MKTNKAYIKYFASLLLFGMNGIVASYITMNSYEIVFTRTLIGSVLLVLILKATRKKIDIPENKSHFLYLLISGMALGISWLFVYEAYKQIGVSVATLAYYCGPVIVMILSPILFHEKIVKTKLLGFITVLIGMFCVNMQVLTEKNNTWGLFCGIMAAVMYAFMIIFSKKAKSITGLENSMWQLLASFFTVAIFLGVKQGYRIHIEPDSIIPILILGIVNTGIGCYLYFSSICKLPVQTVAICGYLEPLSAVIFSIIFLNEKMGAAQLLGTVLILGGAVFGELLGRKENARLSFIMKRAIYWR